MIVTKTPFRISLLGGGTDFKDYYKISGGSVVSFSFNKYMYINLNLSFDQEYRIAYSKVESVKRVQDIQHNIVRNVLEKLEEDKILEIVSIADIPSTGSGLGSSSAFTVGLIKAIMELRLENISAPDLARYACEVEIDMLKSPIGKQDQYAVSLGGLNQIVFNQNDSVFARKIELSNSFKNHLFKSMVIFHTNKGRSANEVLSKPTSVADKDKIQYLDTLKSLVTESESAFLNQDLEGLGRLVLENHKLKSSLNVNSGNLIFENVLTWALKNGAHGGKILGAGGGGFGLILGTIDVLNKLKKEFTDILFFDIELDELGSRVVLNDK